MVAKDVGGLSLGVCWSTVTDMKLNRIILPRCDEVKFKITVIGFPTRTCRVCTEGVNLVRRTLQTRPMGNPGGGGMGRKEDMTPLANPGQACKIPRSSAPVVHWRQKVMDSADAFVDSKLAFYRAA